MNATSGPRRELTARALVTGLVLGALLAPCNVYSGLKIGFSFNMSITALLLAYMFWMPVVRILRLPSWGLYESNICQTSASSAASIISGGLVAPIPALALIQGGNLAWPALIAWVFSVSFLGVWVGWYLRPRLIERSSLVFPAGMATAETLKDVFNHGREATLRIRVLLSAFISAAVVSAVDKLLWQIPRWAPSGIAQKYTFSFDPSLLMFGFGAIIGVRAATGLLLGAIVAWGMIAPILVAEKIVRVPEGYSGFQPLVNWLLWPGVTLMVVASLSSFLFLVLRPRAGETHMDDPRCEAHIALDDGSKRARFTGLLTASALAVVLQIAIFDVHWTMALLAIPFAFALAAVAAKVVGETGIAPIGAIGKVSQLGFAALAPGQIVTNLMTANVAGGAAGQSADLLNDLRAGHEVGANPSAQIVAQCGGVLIGAIVGSVVYLQLIPNPSEQLLTSEWPAPAVATWKAVAETLSLGLSSIPDSAVAAMLIAVLVGVASGATEAFAGPKFRRLFPSGTSMGLAFVIPASLSITVFLGAAAATILLLIAPNWHKRFLLSLAAGLVAGESLFGVFSLWI